MTSFQYFFLGEAGIWYGFSFDSSKPYVSFKLWIFIYLLDTIASSSDSLPMLVE